jgi:hypothetical protein
MKETYEVPEMLEVGGAETVVQGMKPSGLGDNQTAPFRLESVAASDED